MNSVVMNGLELGLRNSGQTKISSASALPSTTGLMGISESCREGDAQLSSGLTTKARAVAPFSQSRRPRFKTSTTKWVAFVLTFFLLSWRYEVPAHAQAVAGGGLTAPEIGGSLGPNLLVNGDFSQGTAGWSLPSACFSLDPTTPAPNGAASLLMSDTAACNNPTPVAINSLKVKSGQVYTLSGQLKTEDLVAASSVDGAMFDLLGLRPFTDHQRHHRLDQHDVAASDGAHGQ